MGKIKKDKIKVSFIGNNAEHVAGSQTLIETQNHKILIECGLIQGESTPLNNYKENAKPFKFKPKDIDIIFIAHVHADHICMLPRLYAQGCTAKIIAPKGTYDIAKIIMKDSAFIMSKDTEYFKRKLGKDCPPLITSENVDECLKYWTEFDFNYSVNLNEEIKFNFIQSGHIINSAQLELFITQNNITKKILYTSDLGSEIPQYYVNKFTKCKNANLVIGETTYCEKDRSATKKDRKTDIAKIKSVIEDICLDRKAKVLIPCFALHRTQMMLGILYDMFKDCQDFPLVIVDSPMACKITKLYENLLEGKQLEHFKEVMSWNRIKFVEEYEISKMYQKSSEPLILVSASGMLNSGRSLNWCAKLLPNPNNCILFVGYSAENTLGYKIKQGKQKTVTIDGKSIPNRCSIVDLKSFSSHRQYEGLINYYSNINCEKIALVHGEMKNKIDFANELQEEIYKNNKTSRVVCVNRSTSITL